MLDGRDIGTIVCPDAAAKLFVTASPEERARRRHRELRRPRRRADLRGRARGHPPAGRARHGAAPPRPLRQAADATLLDTTALDVEAAFARAVEIVEAARERFVAPQRRALACGAAELATLIAWLRTGGSPDEEAIAMWALRVGGEIPPRGKAPHGRHRRRVSRDRVREASDSRGRRRPRPRSTWPLVLAVDISFSMDTDEQELQRAGFRGSPALAGGARGPSIAG